MSAEIARSDTDRMIRGGYLMGLSQPPANGAMLGRWIWVVTAPGPHGRVPTDRRSLDRDEATRWAMGVALSEAP